MNLFETVKNNVSLREAAQAYGLEVNRHGKALCPFHNDRHPSLYVANDHYYCFTCGEHGDVIDFTARLFDLKPYDAAMKLVIDFHLDPDKPPSAAALNAKRIRTEAQKLKENERLCFSVLSDYLRWCEDNAQKPMSANRISSELAQNERLYNVEATNNVYAAGKRVRGFIGVEAMNLLPY